MEASARAVRAADRGAAAASASRLQSKAAARSFPELETKLAADGSVVVLGSLRTPDALRALTGATASGRQADYL